MPIIDVPNYGQVEFPDGMSDADIVAAIKKNAMGYSKPEPTQLERFGQGLKDPIDAGAQLLTKMLPESVVQAGNKANNWLADKTGLVSRLPEGGIDQQVKETGEKYKTDGVDWSRMAGNVLSPANLAIASKLPVAATTAGRVGTGALGGAGIGALTPTIGDNFWEDKATQVGASAAFGGALPMLTGAASRLISPKASVNPDVKLLQSEGVNLTAGQQLGGMWNRLEEKLQSIPFAGDSIAAARERSRETFNKAAINRALAPIGEKTEIAGQEGVKRAGDLLSKTYDDAIAKLNYVKFDGQFATDLRQLQSMATGLEPKFQSQFNKIISDKFGTKLSNNGSMLGDNYKKVISDIGKESERFAGMESAAARDYASAVQQLQSLMKQQIGRGGNPEAAELFKAADKGYANLVRIEGASKAAKSQEGNLFTPAQLNTAIQGADSSVRKRAVSRGTSLMQDLGNAGQSVIGNKVPNSGTADRAFAGLGTGAVGFADPLSTGLALGAGSLAYTQPAQKAAEFLLSRRPQAAKAIAERVRNSSPYLIPAGAGLLNY